VKKRQKTETPKTVEAPEAKSPDVEAASEEPAAHAKKFGRTETQFKSLNSWGVRDRAGEWITIPGDPDVASMDYRSISRTAKNVTRPEALRAFEKLPDAFQLIDGCDWWACLSDEDEVLVVVKEKTDVLAPEAVRGAGGD
jgi:hypothetical protein